MKELQQTLDTLMLDCAPEPVAKMARFESAEMLL